jgi:glycosyltransferase involved in cell wall biosynthesis
MRAIVLTPQATGADGVSALSRQVVAALAVTHHVEVWSLHDTLVPTLPRDVAFHGAGSSRVAFAARAMRETNVDTDTIVVALHVHLLPVALPLVQRGARLVAILLGIEAWKPLGVLERAALRRAWKIAAISRHTIDRFRDANPACADRVVSVCHPGVPAAAVSPGIIRGAEPAKAGPHPYALIVGRMSADERYKGHDQLLEIWAEVMRAVAGARLLIVGGGDDVARLREKAGGLGLDGNIVFTGAVDDERLAALYREARVFAMPSRDEGFGLVYLEAMRAGRPCIAAYGAAEEVVVDGETGLIVDPEDKVGLRNAVVRLLSDDDLCARMGAAGAARVAECFSDRAFAARLCALLEIPHPPSHIPAKSHPPPLSEVPTPVDAA